MSIESLFPQDTILHLLVLLLFSALTSLQTYAFIKQRHRNLLVYLFTGSLDLYTVALLISFISTTVNTLLFVNEDVEKRVQPYIPLIPNILKVIATTFFILFALIIAKGWPITRSEVVAKPLVAISIIVYFTLETLLFVNTRDLLNDNERYLTLYGALSSGFRIVLMIWFLLELRSTMMLEQDQKKLRFYLHFGVGIMVWFAYLPILVLIAFQIEFTRRFPMILFFSLFVNLLAYAIVSHFLWPSKLTYQFLTHPDSDCTDSAVEDCEEGSHDNLNCFANSNYAIDTRFQYQFNPNSEKCAVATVIKT